jgi:hypothetical protein
MEKKSKHIVINGICIFYIVIFCLLRIYDLKGYRFFAVNSDVYSVLSVAHFFVFVLFYLLYVIFVVFKKLKRKLIGVILGILAFITPIAFFFQLFTPVFMSKTDKIENYLSVDVPFLYDDFFPPEIISKEAEYEYSYTETFIFGVFAKMELTDFFSEEQYYIEKERLAAFEVVKDPHQSNKDEVRIYLRQEPPQEAYYILDEAALSITYVAGYY